MNTMYPTWPDEDAAVQASVAFLERYLGATRGTRIGSASPKLQKQLRGDAPRFLPPLAPIG